MKKIGYGIALAIFFLAGIWLTHRYYTWQEVKTQEQSQVLLEKVKNVFKLITTEGYFSEVYDYENYWGYDISPFKKKALIRVKAKVSVGYDLEGIRIETLPAEKKIILHQLPEPSILSIDHDLDYYDITEGVFNSFSKEDYNTLNANAKNFIIEQAKESDLLNSARNQRQETLEMLRFMVENAGWELIYPKDLVKQSTIDKLLE